MTLSNLGLRSRNNSLIILFLLVMAVYLPSLFNDFTYDDRLVLIDSDILSSGWKSISMIFSKDYFTKFGEATFRPVVTLSYIFQAPFSWEKPFVFHYVNIFLHFLVVLCIYFFLERKGFSSAAFVGAALFAIHPAHSEAVLAIGFREDLLATLFVLGAILWFNSESGSTLLMGSICCLFAYFSKESAAVLPGLVVISGLWRNPSESRKFPIKAFVCSIVALMVYLAIYLFIMNNPSNQTTSSLGGNTIFRLLHFPSLFYRYLLISVFPAGLCVDHLILPMESFTHQFWLGCGFLLLGITLGYRFFPSFGAGFLWFLISLTPVSNFFPIEHPFAERYLYLPMVGLALLSAHFWETPTGRFGRSKSAFFLIVALAFSARTFIRTFDFKDARSLFTSSIQYPCAKSTYVGLALTYLDKNDLQPEKAFPLLKKALDLDPTAVKTYDSLGLAYILNNQYDEAIRCLNKAIELNPDYYHSYNYRAVALLYKGRRNEALRDVEQLIRMGGVPIPELLRVLNLKK